MPNKGSKRTKDFESLEMCKKTNTKKESRVEDKPSPCSLFPPIAKEQFIPGNDKYIPPLHDKIT